MATRRRIFISYQHRDQMKAKGFNLLRWNKSVDFEFVGRHLLDPVDSTDSAYVTRKIKEQLQGTSVTVVLIGKESSESSWMAREIEWSLEKNPPNGILGIRLEPAVKVPDELITCGAEIIDWDVHEFANAIERAALACGRAEVISRGPGGGTTCAR